MKKKDKKALKKRMIELMFERIRQDLEFEGVRQIYRFRWEGGNFNITIESSDIIKLVEKSVEKEIKRVDKLYD